MTYDISDILKLSAEEKLRIIGDIHDSIEQDNLSLPDWQIEELKKREELHRQNPADIMEWAEFRKTLEQP